MATYDTRSGKDAVRPNPGRVCRMNAMGESSMYGSDMGPQNCSPGYELDP